MKVSYLNEVIGTPSQVAVNIGHPQGLGIVREVTLDEGRASAKEGLQVFI